MLQWTPSDTFTATGTYFMDETFQDGWYRATGEDWAAREQNNRLQEVLTAEASILALNLEWDVGWATITSATANLDFYSYRKVDRTFLGIDQFWDDARLTVLDDTWDDTLSEELRIVSAPDQFGNFDWIAGIFYSDFDPYVEVGDYIGIGDRYDQNNAGDRFVAAAPHQEYVTPFPEGYVSPVRSVRSPWHLSRHDLSGNIGTPPKTGGVLRRVDLQLQRRFFGDGRVARYKHHHERLLRKPGCRCLARSCFFRDGCLSRVHGTAYQLHVEPGVQRQR